MGGPRVTLKTEKFIIQIWMNLRNDGSEPSAKEVLAAAEAYIETHYIKDIFLPKVRKVQQILLQARKNEKELPSEQKLMQQPWNMATLQDYPLPPESIPAIMYVWRYALVTGEKFTIRQAKWVSRIYSFWSDLILPDKVLLLWLASYEYARKEEATLVSKRSFDTFNEDLRLVFSTLEAVTIWKTIHGEKPFPDPFATSIPYADDGDILHEVLHPVDYYNALYNNTISNDRDKELHYLLAKMPSIGSIGLVSLELMVTYLIWVTHFKQKPEWQNISAKHAADLIDKLRKWALKQQSVKYDPKTPGKKMVAANIANNQIFIDSQLPVPEEALNLLSKYAAKREQK